MTAIGLACCSAVLFGAMSVGLRLGLNRYPDATVATVATIVGALAVALVAAAAEAPARGVHLAAAWPFLLAGLLQPGAGQLLVTLAVRDAGASRASVVFGAAPLISVTIALVALGEPLEWALVAGALLIVAGGFELVRERSRPAGFRALGLVYAFAVTILFATRDNLLRWLAGDTATPAAVAAAASLCGGLFVIGLVLGPRVRRAHIDGAVWFLGVGLLFGLSYVALFEAYYRGRVTVVSPIVATESLWAVALALLLIRRTELISLRVVLGAILTVAGGVLIGLSAG